MQARGASLIEAAGLLFDPEQPLNLVLLLRIYLNGRTRRFVAPFSAPVLLQHEDP